MPLTTVDLNWVRDEIGTGTPPSDDDLDGFFDELGLREAVALRVLKRRRADLLADPTSFSLFSGVLSADTSANLRSLDAQIKPLQAIVDAQFGTLSAASSSLPGRYDVPR
jgi:hypothetical protein